MMVAEVMVTVGKAAARAAVVAALYNVLSADAPVGAPPEGNAKEVTERRRRVTTTASSNDGIMMTGSDASTRGRRRRWRGWRWSGWRRGWWRRGRRWVKAARSSRYPAAAASTTHSVRKGCLLLLFLLSTLGR